LSESKGDSTQDRTPAVSTRTFEQALAELEQRVRKIDSGELSLEEALLQFEEGVAIVQECHEKLDSAERRILELSEEPSGLVEKEFQP
jgi:exodeoxyribonuclease VII small subunit